MTTENENWKDNVDENQQSNREQRSYNRESRYNRYDNSSNRGERPSYHRNDDGNTYRPSSNWNRGERPQRPYNNYGNGERPQRPRINRNYNDGGERPNYNRDENGERRPYRPRFNREEGNGGERRPYNRYENNGNRYDNNGNRYDNGNRYERADRPQRPYNNYGNDERPRYPRNNNQEVDGNRYANYNEEGNGERPQRPHFRPYDNNRRPQQQGGGFRPRRNNSDGYNPNAKYSKKKQFQYREQLADPDEPIRLNKYLANAGVCSRREADEFITAGVVSVNGVVVTELGSKVKRGDNITFHDQPVTMERKVYVLLNKPKDCVTTSEDPQERKTVMDFVQGACKERIYPVGRLDRNTTGVLLLTNDGDLASKLTHPKFLKKKIYHVRCDKAITKADIDQIASGITLEDGEIHADEISYVGDSKTEVGIEIHSGKNRIVRRIFESLGYRIMKLDRVFFAGLTKKNLRRGQWRYLSDKEVYMLRMGAFE